MFYKSHRAEGSHDERCVPGGLGASSKRKTHLAGYREGQVRAPVEYMGVFTTNSLNKHLSQCVNTESKTKKNKYHLDKR